MQWGLIGVNVGIFAQPEHAASFATAAEAAGFARDPRLDKAADIRARSRSCNGRGAASGPVPDRSNLSWSESRRD